jgi:hypothetical protein
MKSNILSLLVFTAIFTYTTTAQAQVGIGTNSPGASAQLEVTSTSKGFLPPRVTLQGTDDATKGTPTIVSPATGLLVYNSASAGSGATAVTPGFYYYDGAKWQRIINQQPDATVTFDGANPNSGTNFSGTTQSRDFIYVSNTDNSQWTWNGSAYVTFTPAPSTPWYQSGGTIDAGSSKTGTVYRTGSVGIGSNTTPNTNSLLDLNSTTKGFLPPRMTSTQRNALTTPAGLVVYNSIDNRLDVLQNTTWRSLATLDGTETLTNKTLTTPTIASGSSQWPSSLSITPTTHGTSKRAAIWIDGWSLLQDIAGDGTKNFGIGQTVLGSPTTYPVRLFIHTSGNVGIGNELPNARLDIRTSPASTSDPGVGYLGIGTTSTAANTAGAGAIRYSTSSGGVLQYSNGTAWNTFSSNVQKSLVSGYFNANTYTNTYYGDLTATEVLDVNNDFASSTFTAPRTGYYTFTATISSNAANDIMLNGTWELQVTPSSGDKMVSRYISPAASTLYTATVTGAYTVQLTAGATVKFQIYNSTGSSKTLAGQDYNRFSIVEN